MTVTHQRRTPEHDIQSRIMLALSLRGGVVLRMNNGLFYTRDGRPIRPGYPNGTSDLIYVGQGFTAFIEVKNEIGRTSPEQDRFLARMKSLGHRVGVARSVDDALRIIDDKTDMEG